MEIVYIMEIAYNLLFLTIMCSEQASCVVGSPRIVKYQLLELLSPISFHHGANFLAAVAVAWHERRQPSTASKKVKNEITKLEISIISFEKNILFNINLFWCRYFQKLVPINK